MNKESRAPAWVMCDYQQACLVQGANKRVQMWQCDEYGWLEWKDVDSILVNWLCTEFSSKAFRYDANDYPTEQPKSRPDLFPPRALQLAGEVLAFGEQKHPNAPWKKMTVDAHVAATLRHMLEHLSGVSNDAESGKPHLAHALVRLGMALEQHVTQR